MPITLVQDRSVLGQKRECYSCMKRFYDFGRVVEECPLCGSSMLKPVARARHTISARETDLEDHSPAADIEINTKNDNDHSETVDPDEAALAEIGGEVETDNDIDSSDTFMEEEDTTNSVDDLIVNTPLDDDEGEE